MHAAASRFLRRVSGGGAGARGCGSGQGGQGQRELEEGRDVGWANAFLFAVVCIKTAACQCADEGLAGLPVS